MRMMRVTMVMMAMRVVPATRVEVACVLGGPAIGRPAYSEGGRLTVIVGLTCVVWLVLLSLGL